MPPTSDSLNFTTRVDLSGLQSGMQQAAQTVQTGGQTIAQAMQAAQNATQNLAQAQQQLGASAAAGNQQAAAIIAQYQQALQQAQTAVQQLTAAQQTQTQAAFQNAAANTAAAQATNQVGISARQAAGSGIGILEGRMMSGNRAAAAMLTTYLGLGPVIEAAFPIIGAVALAEVLVDVAGKVSKLYDEFVNLRSLQDEVWKQLSAGEQEAVNISSEHLRLMREQQVLMAENQGGKTGRSARGEEAGANFDLAQAKNNLAIVNAQIAEFQSRVDDLQKRANATQPFSLMTKDAKGQDQKTAAIELTKAQQDLANAQAQQRNIQTQIDNAAVQGSLRKKQAAEDAEQAVEASTAKQLAAEKQSEELVDREAKKEEDQYKKLDEIKAHANDHARSLKPDETDDNIDSYIQKTIQLNDAQVQAYEIQEQNVSSLNEASIRAKAATGAITPLAEAYSMAAEHSRQFAQELGDLNALLAEQQRSGNDVGAAVTRNQISQTQGRQGVANVQDQANIASQMTQPYMRAFDSINNAWLQTQSRLIMGTRNIGRAFAQMGAEMVVSVAASFERMIIKSLESEIRMTLAHQVANQQKVASDQTASTQSQAISTETGLKQVLIEAKKAAAGAWSALSDIPVVGPALGAAAAAATFAGVMALAAFETGGIIPNTGVALVHQGEAVLPRGLTDLLMATANNGNTGRGSNVSVNAPMNLHGTTDRQFRNQLMRHSDAVVRSVQRGARKAGKVGKG